MKSAPDARMTRQRIFSLIESELEQVEIRLKSEALSNLPLIGEMNRYLHNSGGKRLRPSLLLLTSKLCGIKGESPVQLGVVIELIHVATLVHDDIIDHSEVRRGQASVNAKWGNERTVLFGDWLYMTAFWLALRENNFRVLDILLDIARKMVEGELMQLEWSNRLDISIKDHLKINARKTAHLFAGCGRLSAVTAGLEPDLEERLARYGRSVGMAFQLIDDLLDYSSDEETLGKPVLKDLQEGKITLPLIFLMKRADAEQKAFLQNVVLQNDFSEENRKRILQLVHDSGALEDLRKMALDYAREASEAITVFPDSIYREALLELPDLILHRKR